MSPRNLVDKYQLFGGIYYLLQDIYLMKAAGRHYYGLEDVVKIFFRNIAVSLQTYAILQLRRSECGNYFAVLAVIDFVCP
jgi:hypothetical protein